MSNNTTSARFNFDFVNKHICGTQASFDKASKGYGPVYEELATKMAQHPTFSCVIVAPEKPAKPKQTYRGMNILFMLDYASAVGDADFRTELEKVRNHHKNGGEIEFSVYPTVKRMFFAHYVPNENERFAYAKAKNVVSNYRHNGIVKAVTSHTEPATDYDDNIEQFPKAVND